MYLDDRSISQGECYQYWVNNTQLCKVKMASFEG